MPYQIIIIAILSLIVLSVIVYNFYFVYYFFTKKAPYVPSFDKQLKIIKEELNLNKNKSLVDLWCWDWKALRFFNKNYRLKGEGYDINYFALFYGKFLNKLYWYKNINLHRKNFFSADLKKYDYVYLYLRPSQLEKMEEWIFSNIKKDAVVISNSFQFKNNKPYKTIKKDWVIGSIFLYKKIA